MKIFLSLALLSTAAGVLHAQTTSAASAPVYAKGCIYILNPGTAAYPLAVDYPSTGSTSGVFTNCAVYVNSKSNAVGVGPNSTLITQSLSTVGAATTSQANVQPSPSFASPVADPFAAVPAPSLGSCSYNSLSVTANATLSPGTYCGGLTISAASVLLRPGLYIIVGPLTIQNGASVSGNGVTFYLTKGNGSAFGPVKILNSTLNLTAPIDTTRGGATGILFFGDRNWNQPGTQGVQVSASAIQADGFWYFAHVGLANSGSAIVAPNYGGLVVDNLLTRAASFAFPQPDYSVLLTAPPIQ